LIGNSISLAMTRLRYSPRPRLASIGQRGRGFFTWPSRSARACLWFALTTTSVVCATSPVLDKNFWPGPVRWVDPADDEIVRVQALGPILERVNRPGQTVSAVRPFWLKIERHDDYLSLTDTHILYPLYTYRTFRDGSESNLLYLLRWGYSGELATAGFTRRELFPFYFDYQSGIPNQSYRGLFPIHGTIRNRFFYDRISWTAFPVYSEWEKDGGTTTALIWPFLRWRHGGEHSGWAFWPFYGQFEKPDRYRQRYAVWPLYYDYWDRFADGDERRRFGVLPFYAYKEKPDYIAEIYLWPFFGYTRTENPDYLEHRYFWPFFVQGRGEETYVNRWAPVYTHSIRRETDKKWVLWPLFNQRVYPEGPLEVRVQRFLYVLYWNMRQRDPERPEAGQVSKTHLWPLFSHWDNGAGRVQFQLLSPLEVWFPKNQPIRDLYAPLFSLYRYHEDEGEQQVSHRLLFSLIVYESAPEWRRFSLGPLLDLGGGERGGFSLLSGLIRFESANTAGENRRWRFLWR